MRVHFASALERTQGQNTQILLIKSLIYDLLVKDLNYSALVANPRSNSLLASDCFISVMTSGYRLNTLFYLTDLKHKASPIQILTSHILYNHQDHLITQEYILSWEQIGAVWPHKSLNPVLESMSYLSFSRSDASRELESCVRVYGVFEFLTQCCLTRARILC